MLAYILIFTLIGSVLSLFGSFLLIFKKTITESFSTYLVSFAAGVLVAFAFLDLLPEAQEAAGELNFFIPTLLGFIVFFLAERYLRLFHHHHGHGEKTPTALVLIGDGLHNFIDGVAITASFLTSTPLGIATSLAVAAHEIPQEIADMGILLSNGLSKTKALFYNFLSALTAMAGALLAFYFADTIENNLYLFLSLTAGFFIYISASDLIPSLHENNMKAKSLQYLLVFLLGIGLVFISGLIFEA